MYCQRMGSLFQVLINRHSVRAVIPAIGLSFALNKWSDKQWSRQWLGTNRAYMMSSRGSDSSGLSLESSNKPQQPDVTPFSAKWFEPFVSLKPLFENTDYKSHKDQSYVLGSGFIVDKEGLVLTHSSICRQFTKFTVRLGTGEEVVARHVFTSANTSLAVIQLAGNRDDWPVVQLMEGQTYDKPGAQRFHKVLVVSTRRHGLCNQLVEGMATDIKRKGTEISELSAPMQTRNYLQHSANLLAMDSGTAVVNTDGRVIGVNIIVKPERHNIVMYSAFFKNVLTAARARVIAHDCPLLSSVFYELTPDVRQRVAAKRHISEDELPDKGIVLWDVIDDNNDVLRQHFHLNRYDVITRINGVDVNDMDDLYRAVDDLKRGKSVEFELNGAKKVVNLSQTLLKSLSTVSQTDISVVCV